MKRALITGIFGQDGSYLAELLAAENYEVHGIARPQLSPHSAKLQQHLNAKGVSPILHECDLTSFNQVRELISAIRPDECYHLAAVHHSAQTIVIPVAYDRLLLEQNVMSVLNLLHALQETSPQTRFVMAGSCVMFEDCEISPQSESTPFRSSSAYGTSKIIGQQLIGFFRQRHRLHASNAILYNHESPRREAHFVSRKIVNGVVAVRRGEAQALQLGNLDDIKDWGFAGDYVRGMWLMAQANSPGDYVLASGTGRTIAEFVEQVAESLALKNWRDLIEVQPGLTRQMTKTRLVGNPEQARTVLGWQRAVTFDALVAMMVECELSGTLD
jgi:GDPmannose 4,6-dehydratase